MRLHTALLAMTSMVAVPSLAMASTITGPYIDLGGGYNLVQSQHAHFSGAGEDPSKSTYKHGDGFTGFGSVGWGFGNGLRVEVEGVYNYSQITARHGVSNSVGTRGSDQAYGGFVNVLYDIDLQRLGLDVPVTPFVGVGAGYLWQHYNPTDTFYSTAGDRSRLGGTNGSFAYQGIIGAAYDIPGVPGLAVTTEYRFIGQTFTDGAYQHTEFRNGARSGAGHVNFDQRFSHQFILSLRYAFNSAPPPPPAPAVVVPPAPAPARTYLVFFNWDRSDLTGRARAIVAQAAQASTHVQTTRIEVNGYTDNSAAHPGPRGERYNMGLSLRRANSVKAELIRDGVPASAIDIHGYGEAHPLVPTAANTREPQNRRVEIILR